VVSKPLDGKLSKLLLEVDTPTVCNALRVIDPTSCGKNYTIDRVIPADKTLPPVLGYAKTARIMSSEPPADPSAIRARRFDYYRYVAAGPRPSIVVMQDCGSRPGYGCIWGALSVAMHKGLGVAGAITNGAIRDLASLSPGFQLLGGNVCPGSGFAHLIDFDTPVTVFGLHVTPGALMLADQYGAVLIPDSFVPPLYRAIKLVQRRESALLAATEREGFDYDAFVAAWEAMESATLDGADDGE